MKDKDSFSLKIVNSERGNHIRICSSFGLRMRYLILFKHSIIFLFLEKRVIFHIKNLKADPIRSYLGVGVG